MGAVSSPIARAVQRVTARCFLPCEGCLPSSLDFCIVTYSMLPLPACFACVSQVLGGCRRLGWRISKPWWRTFYRDSLPALQQGSAGVCCLSISQKQKGHTL